MLLYQIIEHNDSFLMKTKCDKIWVKASLCNILLFDFGFLMETIGLKLECDILAFDQQAMFIEHVWCVKQNKFELFEHLNWF